MHRAAEYGIAAHWRYKQNEVGGKLGPDDLGWLRQLVEWQRETEDPGEFLESLRYDLGSSEVFVFTPRGDVIALPSGSTPVDFAYAVHTELGHRCVGARVNGRLVPLDSPLGNGDSVEVFTSKAEGAGPSRDWLTFVRSPRAKSKIKAWFSKERREEAIEKGKDALLRAMRKEGVGVHRLLSTAALATVAADLRQPDVSALYASIGEGRISPQTVIHRLVATAGGVSAARTTRRRGSRRRASPRCVSARTPTPASPSSARAWATCGSSSPDAARPCPATRSPASSPAGTGSRCTARTA